MINYYDILMWRLLVRDLITVKGFRCLHYSILHASNFSRSMANGLEKYNGIRDSNNCLRSLFDLVSRVDLWICLWVLSDWFQFVYCMFTWIIYWYFNHNWVCLVGSLCSASLIWFELLKRFIVKFSIISSQGATHLDWSGSSPLFII